jgi:hypothetical protein
MLEGVTEMILSSLLNLFKDNSDQLEHRKAKEIREFTVEVLKLCDSKYMSVVVPGMAAAISWILKSQGNEEHILQARKIFNESFDFALEEMKKDKEDK